MDTRGLPDIYTLSPAALVLWVYIRIRQTTRAHGIMYNGILTEKFIGALSTPASIHHAGTKNQQVPMKTTNIRTTKERPHIYVISLLKSIPLCNKCSNLYHGICI